MTSCVVESLFDWMYAMQMVDFLWIRITQVCQPFLKFSKQTNASVNFQWIGSNAKNNCENITKYISSNKLSESLQ